MMDTDQFWSLIPDGSGSAVNEAHIIGAIEELGKSLALAFAERFQHLVNAANTPELGDYFYFLDVGSEDRFYDFLIWLVLKGEKVYNQAAEEPDKLEKYFEEITPPPKALLTTLNQYFLEAGFSRSFWDGSELDPIQLSGAELEQLEEKFPMTHSKKSEAKKKFMDAWRKATGG